MNVTFSDKVRQAPEEYERLRRVTGQLEDMTGPSAKLVSVAWDRADDERGHPLYKLTLADHTGEVSGTFYPWELSGPRARGRLLTLWGDLLQIRSDTQVRKLLQLVQEGE